MARSTRQYNTRNRRQAPAGPPAWVSFLGGWLTGVVCVFAAGPLWALIVDLVASGEPTVEAAAPVVQWRFAEALRETEVPVRTPEPAAPPAARPPVVSPPAESATQVPVEQRTAPSRERPMLLQAGSFRGRDDADRLRGELLLLGFADVKVAAARLDGATYYRVMLGPFASAATMRAARAKLSEARISALETGAGP